MRIVLVTTRFPPSKSKGGIVTLYHNLALALQRASNEVLVVAYTDGESADYELDGVRVHTVKLAHDDFQLLKEIKDVVPGTCYALEQALKIHEQTREVIARFNPDIIETPEYCAYGLFWALAGEYPVVVRGVGPLFFFAAGGDIGQFTEVDQKLIAAVELQALNSAQGQGAISADLAKRLSDAGRIPLERIDVIKVPIDVPQVPVKPERSAEGRNYPELFYWGRIERQKGCDVLIEAFAKVAARFPTAKLKLAGFENTEQAASKPFAVELRERIAELELTEKVQFLGVLETAQIQEHAKASDMCVFPSRYETAGYTLLEAALCGTCVVSTTAGAIPEYVQHGQSAYLVAPADADALAEGIIKLAGDAELRKSIERTAPDQIKATCGYEVVAQQSVEWYERARAKFRRKQLDASASKIEELILSALAQPSDGKPSALDRGKQLGWDEAGPKCYEDGFRDGYNKAMSEKGSALSARGLKQFVKAKLLGAATRDE